MKWIKYFKAVMLFSVAAFLPSCHEEPVETTEQPVRFSLNNQYTSQNGRKMTSHSAAAIVISVKKASGEVVLQNEKLAVYNLEGYYISDPVDLSPGSYQVTDFMVVDDENNVLFIAPKEGSEKATLVSDPLPVDFQVAQGTVSTVNINVLDAEDDPEDFGYISFSLYNFETVKFKIQVYIKKDGSIQFSGWDDPNLEQTEARIEVSQMGRTYQLTVNPDQEYVEIINQWSGGVSIRVVKENFHTHLESFSIESLENGSSVKILLSSKDGALRYLTTARANVSAFLTPSGSPDKLFYTDTDGLWKLDISNLDNLSDPVFLGNYGANIIAEDHYGTLYLHNNNPNSANRYSSPDQGETWTEIPEPRPTSYFTEFNGTHYGSDRHELYRETNLDQWELIQGILGHQLLEYNNKLFVGNGGYVTEDGVTFRDLPVNNFSSGYSSYIFEAAGNLYRHITTSSNSYIIKWNGNNWDISNTVYEYYAIAGGTPIFSGAYGDKMLVVDDNLLKIFSQCDENTCDPVYTALLPTPMKGGYIEGDQLFLEGTTSEEELPRINLYVLNLSQIDLN